MERIFFISMDSLFPTIFWGNVISMVFLFIYYIRSSLLPERRISIFLILARFCHAFYFFVASGRGILPDILSINIGNTILFAGYYLEAQAILRVIKERTKDTDRLLLTMFTVFTVIFNVMEVAAPMGGIRVAVGSLAVVAIMALPVVRMLLSRDASVYTKPNAAFYIFFLLCNLARAWYGITHLDMSIFTDNALQSLTFISLLLQLLVALPAYTVIIKDYAEKALMLMATTDRLTGVTNRHAFLDSAAAIHRNSGMFRQCNAVLFIDIDHFKQVNDTYGHAFGDEVLTVLAALIDKCLRGSDLSCRYGGEEFVALLPNINSSSAELVGGRIMSEVRQARFEDQPEFSFAVSIGIAIGVPSPNKGLDSFIKAADEAMYQAKRSGRDRIVVTEM